MSEPFAFADLQVGMVFGTYQIELNRELVDRFIRLTSDFHPAYTAPHLLEDAGWNQAIAPPLLAGHYSALKKTIPRMPPEGTLHVAHSIEFRAPIPVGESITFHTRVADKYMRKGKPRVVIESAVHDSQGKAVALVQATYQWAY